MRSLYFLAITFTMLFISTAWAASPKYLRNLLNDSTWCFQDIEGPRQGGRVHFKRNGSGKYDVVDAPAGGGIALSWTTWETGNRASVVIRFASGFNPPRQSADVLILDNDSMAWTWSGGDGTVSLVYRCAR